MATIEDLTARIAQLETQLAQKTSVKVTHQRKLERFSGKVKSKTDDWIEDAKAILRSVAEDEKVPFLLGHLESVAREEIKFAEETDKDTVDKIFKILEDNFGEKRTDAQLKTLLYEQCQKPPQTVREFSRELLELASKMKSQEGREAMLIEAFKENLSDSYVRREVKKKHKDTPNIKFTALRDFAIDLAEDEVCKSANASSNAVSANNVVESNVVGSEVKSMIESMLKCQESLASQQAELLKQLSNRATDGVVNSNRTQGRGRYVKCWYCSKMGHTKKNCFKLANDEKQDHRSGGRTSQAGNGPVPPSGQ